MTTTLSGAHQPFEQPSGNPRMCLVVRGRPVSVNAAYGNTRRRGQRRLTDEAVAWRDLVRAAVIDWRERHGFEPTGRLELTTPLMVKCVFVGIRGDVDNYLKLTLDGLKLGLDIDDREFQHVEATVARKTTTKEQGCLIDIWEAQDPEEELVNEPVTAVTIEPALAYECVVVLIPATPRLAMQEHGFFLTIEHARELHGKLGDALRIREWPEVQHVS